MVADVNKLAELVELDSLPDWLRQAIDLKKDEILEQLRTKGESVIVGPNGKQIRLQAKGKVNSAVA